MTLELWPESDGWQRWFAWYPILVPITPCKSSVFWLEMIERKYDPEYGITEYRPLSKNK